MVEWRLLTHVYIFFLTVITPFPSASRTRRGRPANPSTLAGRLLERRDQNDRTRDREIHERRLRYLSLEEESFKKHVEAQETAKEILGMEKEGKKKKMEAEIAAANADVTAADAKVAAAKDLAAAARDKAAAAKDEAAAAKHQAAAAKDLAVAAKAQAGKNVWEEKLAEKQYLLFLRAHPEFEDN